MTRTYCDDCGEQLGPVHPQARLPSPFDHPEYGVPFLIDADFCAYCCSRLLTAYAGGNASEIRAFWVRVADRNRWSIPDEAFTHLNYYGLPMAYGSPPAERTQAP